MLLKKPPYQVRRLFRLNLAGNAGQNSAVVFGTMSLKRLALFLSVSAAVLLAPTAARVHPHVFAIATMNLVVGANGSVEKLQHNWMFDDAFSSTVLVEFDTNQDLKLDAGELKEVQNTIVNSIGEYNYFQAIKDNGSEVKMARPPNLTASMDGTNLVITFDSAPEKPLPLRGTAVFGIYDPTFYTAIDFETDADLKTAGLPSGCTSKVIRPDPEQAMAENKQNLTDFFYSTTDQTNIDQLVATRLEVTCPK
jgi:ABC-type uncharacterized transport system substrate-binding protein